MSCNISISVSGVVAVESVVADNIVQSVRASITVVIYLKIFFFIGMSPFLKICIIVNRFIIYRKDSVVNHPKLENFFPTLGTFHFGRECYNQKCVWKAAQKKVKK